MGLPYNLVELVDYDPNWVKLYNNEAIMIKNAMSDESVEICHIGSTAISGMISKPIIDIMIGINNVYNAHHYTKLLEKAGYECFGECGRPGRIFFVKGSLENCTHHLHLVEKGSSYWVGNLLFKDYMQNNPEAATEYATIKKNLAKRYNRNRDLYRLYKSEYVDRIVESLVNKVF